ncbi:Hypothetical predicted protein, partial [Mytilus galloprovincialis]
ETKLPCHVLGQRVLFHSGSTNTACIHYKTCSETIKELIEKGFNEFERAETLVDGKAEDEIDYFKTMAERDDNKFDLLQEYETDIIKPWRVKQSHSEKNNIQQDQQSEEFLLPSEIPFGLDALVCNCLIGVCIEEERRGKRNDVRIILET